LEGEKEEVLKRSRFHKLSLIWIQLRRLRNERKGQKKGGELKAIYKSEENWYKVPHIEFNLDSIEEIKKRKKRSKKRR